MKLFIDSSQRIFAAAILDENNVVIKEKLVDTKYKVEEIINFFESISDINQIEKIYINLGPGSFTGSRISLLYVRTMAQINSNIKIFTTNTFLILKRYYKKNFYRFRFYINASKNKSYRLTKNKTELVRKSRKEKIIDYERVIQKFSKFETVFSEKHINDIRPIYASDPQIGEVKK